MPDKKVKAGEDALTQTITDARKRFKSNKNKKGGKAFIAIRDLFRKNRGTKKGSNG